MPLSITQFVGGPAGPWQVERVDAVIGANLRAVERLAVVEGTGGIGTEAGWVLRGAASYERYTIRTEHDALVAAQEVLGRPKAECAALIPVAKSAAWWALPQDERRQIFEDRSMHIRTGARYLPAVARRLYQSRDLGEPFDFLTWFEYAPSDAAAFEELVALLRATEEWSYVDREVDVRLRRVAG